MARRLQSASFIGRGFELDRLRAAAGQAADGRASMLLVGGEAGVGKSRLIAEVADDLVAEGWLKLAGGAMAMGKDGLPFGPIVEALHDLSRSVDEAELVAAGGASLPELLRLVPELPVGEDAEAPTQGQPAWLQARIFQAFRALLAGLARARPVLFVVEDLQWADRSTRELLAFLAQTARDERLLLVVSIRTDELHRRHPLIPWLGEVERLPMVDRLDLRRFDRPELAALVGAILGERPSAALVRSLEERSGGNAFFVEELLATSGDVSGSLPATLREVLLVRLTGVGEAAAHLAEVASVAGGDVDHDVLAEVSGLPEPQLIASLKELVGAQLLVAGSDEGAGRYGFRHALVREAVRDELLPAERRRIHGAYATALEGRVAGPVPVQARRLVEIAHHWLQSGDGGRALAASLAAADAALASYAFAEAAGLYERAIEGWASVDDALHPPGRDLGELFEAAGASAALAGDSRVALDRSRRAMAFADETGRPDRRARVRFRLAEVAQQVGDTETSIGALEDAARLLDDQPASLLRARVLERLARNLMLAGRSHDAVPVAERAIAESRAISRADDDADVVQSRALVEANALATLGVARCQLGDVTSGITASEQARDLAAILDDPWLALRAYANLGVVLERAGRIESALASSVAGLTRLRELGASDGMFAGSLEVNAATLLIQLGRYDEADALLHPLADAPLPGFAAANIHGAIADLAWRRGDLDAARHHLEVARAKLVNLDDAQYTISQATIATEIDLWAGDLDAAMAKATVAFASLGEKDDALLVGPLAAAAVRAAAEIALAARARRDHGAADEALEAAARFTDGFRASIERMIHPDELALGEVEWRLELCAVEVARGRGEDEPAAWAAVRERSGGDQRRFLAAYLCWRQAEANLRGAGAAAGVELLRAAHATAGEIGARRLAGEIERVARAYRVELAPEPAGAVPEATPGEPVAAGDATVVDPFGLTRREREVLVLLAEGFTNRRIADTLFISESTAGVHVSNILGKLGATSRTEAAAIAIRAGLDTAPADDSED